MASRRFAVALFRIGLACMLFVFAMTYLYSFQHPIASTQILMLPNDALRILPISRWWDGPIVFAAIWLTGWYGVALYSLAFKAEAWSFTALGNLPPLSWVAIANMAAFLSFAALASITNGVCAGLIFLLGAYVVAGVSVLTLGVRPIVEVARVIDWLIASRVR